MGGVRYAAGMLSTVRGIFREGHVELQEPAPREVARVLVTFLLDEEDTSGEAPEREGHGHAAVPLQPHPAWPQDLVDFLIAESDPLIERQQPAEPERKDIGL